MIRVLGDYRIKFSIGNCCAGAIKLLILDKDGYPRREPDRRTVGWHPIGIYYTRPPIYAALLRPFTWIPYRTAYLLFQILSLGAAILSVLLMTRRSLIVAAMLLFFPLM